MEALRQKERRSHCRVAQELYGVDDRHCIACIIENSRTKPNTVHTTQKKLQPSREIFLKKNVLRGIGVTMCISVEQEHCQHRVGQSHRTSTGTDNDNDNDNGRASSLPFVVLRW